MPNAYGAESFDWVDGLITNPIRMKDGFAYPNDGDGWGFSFKDEKLTGRKLLIVRQTDEAGSPTGKPYVAIDTVDAGIGDLVLTAAGSSARQTAVTKDTPVDAVIMEFA